MIKLIQFVFLDQLKNSVLTISVLTEEKAKCMLLLLLCQCMSLLISILMYEGEKMYEARLAAANEELLRVDAYYQVVHVIIV